MTVRWVGGAALAVSAAGPLTTLMIAAVTSGGHFGIEEAAAALVIALTWV